MLFRRSLSCGVFVVALFVILLIVGGLLAAWFKPANAPMVPASSNPSSTLPIPTSLFASTTYLYFTTNDTVRGREQAWRMDHQKQITSVTSPKVLSPQLNKNLQEMPLPQNIVGSDGIQSLGTWAGYDWFATYQPGEGIELPPTGPSELLRVDARHATSTILVEPDPIVSMTMSEDGSRLAYITTANKSTAVVGNAVVDLPEGFRPLVWGDADTLFVTRGKSLFRVSLSDPGRALFLTDLPDQPIRARLSTSLPLVW